MKTKTILITLCTLFLLLGGMGCEDETTTTPDFSYLKCLPNAIKGKKDSIVGKWKLVQTWSKVGETEGAVIIDTIDVSCQNIYYEFKKNNLLTVSGGGQIPEGDYAYTYQVRNVCSLCDPSPNLSITGFDAMDCTVKEYEMIINLQLFVRTK